MRWSQEQLAAVLRYLAGFPLADARKGESFHATGTISLRQEGDHLLGTVAASGEPKRKVDLDWDGESWFGECSCADCVDCEHCYAVMRQLLNECPIIYTNQETGETQPAQSVRAAAPVLVTNSEEGFAKEVALKLGRTLKDPERRYLNAVFSLWRQFGNAPNISEWSLREVAKASKTRSYHEHQIWDRRPISPWEAWLYLAAFIEREKRVRPQFLFAITDPAEIQRVNQERRFRMEESKWRERFESVFGRALVLRGYRKALWPPILMPDLWRRLAERDGTLLWK